MYHLQKTQRLDDAQLWNTPTCHYHYFLALFFISRFNDESIQRIGVNSAVSLCLGIDVAVKL